MAPGKLPGGRGKGVEGTLVLSTRDCTPLGAGGQPPPLDADESVAVLAGTMPTCFGLALLQCRPSRLEGSRGGGAPAGPAVEPETCRTPVSMRGPSAC